MFNLKGKNIVVTGGSKGIGKATVEIALSLGANVLAISRGQASLDELKNSQKNHASTANLFTLACDVSKVEGRMAIIEGVKKHLNGTVHGLVNNAGTNIRKAVEAYTEEEWRSIIELNQHAPFEICRLMRPFLEKASVVNVASVAGFIDVRSGTPYAMSKSAMIQMSRSLASEWAAVGIRVNTVSPWYTKTPLVASVLSDQERLQKILEATPLGRIAEAEEVANVIAFLLMDASSYMTGQNLIVDGGMSIQAF